MGSDESKELPYKVIKDDNGNIKIKCSSLNKDFSPEEISAQVIRKLITDAKDYLGQDVTKAVITVPAYFNDSQRQATVDAGIFEVLSTAGDTNLGGDDFDKALVRWLVEDFKEKEGTNLIKDIQALQRLTEAAEKAKIELSNVDKTTINLPFITADKTGIDEVVLVGGSTRIPAIQQLVESLTGKKPNKSVNPDEVVAIGAAIQAGILAGEITDILLLDVTP